MSNAGSARDAGSILGLGRFPGGRNGNPLHYSCLENSMDGEAWQATAHGVTASQMRLSTTNSTCVKDILKGTRSQTEEKYCMTSLICGI